MSRGELSELMAILGCDAQPLEDGLAKAEVLMDEAAMKMLASVKTIEEGLLAMKTIIPAATEGIINQILFGTGAASPQKAVTDVLAAIQLMRGTGGSSKDDKYLAETSDLNERMLAERQAAIDFESSMDAEIFAQRQAHDAMMAAEGERAIGDQSRIDAEAEAQRIAARKRLNAALLEADMTFYAEQNRLRKVGMAEDQYQADLEYYLNNRRGPTGTVNSGNVRGTAYELQALEQIFNIKLPWAFSRIMATLPQIQTLMAGAFNAILVIGFVDILVLAGEKLVQLTDYVNGWGEANQKAWEKADKAAMSSVEKMIKVQRDYDIIRGMSKEGADKKEIERINSVLGGPQQRLKELQAEKAAIDARNDSYHSGYAGEGTFGIGGRLVVASLEYINDLVSRRAQIEKEIDDITGHQIKLTDDKRTLEASMMQQREQHAKRMRDEVHEYPHVLPWFMGQRSSDIFTQDVMGPTLSRNWQAPQSKGGVTFNPVYAPQIHVMGSDVAHFRNKVMPQLMEDLKNNSRGHAKELARIMKTHE